MIDIKLTLSIFAALVLTDLVKMFLTDLLQQKMMDRVSTTHEMIKDLVELSKKEQDKDNKVLNDK